MLMAEGELVAIYHFTLLSHSRRKVINVPGPGGLAVSPLIKDLIWGIQCFTA